MVRYESSSSAQTEAVELAQVTGRVSLGSLGVPPPEAVLQSYSTAARQLDLTLQEGVNLGQALAAMQKRPAYFIRAKYGLYPCNEPHDTEGIMNRFQISRNAVYKNLPAAENALRQEATLLTPERASTLRTLEETARLIEKMGHLLTSERLDLVLAIHGLPPYLAPVSSTKRATDADVKRQTVDNNVRYALETMEAASTEIPTEEKPEIPIPDHTATVVQHLQVAETLHIEIPEGATFGQMLSRLERRQEHLIRAQHGMYPYDRSYAPDELAALHRSTTTTIKNSLNVAYARLRTLNSDAVRDFFPLEDIARRLRYKKSVLPAWKEDLIRAARGLPPYILPVHYTELAQQHNKQPLLVERMEKRAIATLFTI